MEFDAENEILILMERARKLAHSDSQRNEQVAIWEDDLESALEHQGSGDSQKMIEGTQALASLFSKVLQEVDKWERK